MKIINLIEDTQGLDGFRFEHGLSFYIETEKHKLLLDTGATDAFIQNALLLGVDLSSVDMVILSHGHYDHAGGILSFVQINPNAKIYLQKNAGLDYYNLKDNKTKYIGINKEIMDLPQCEIISGNLRIDDELFLFTNITGRKFFAKSNYLLKKKVGDVFVQDSFDHEQCLVITENGRNTLISGCAHNGMLNIFEEYFKYFDDAPKLAISGFHMIKATEYDENEVNTIKETAYALLNYDTVYYTGHCTGMPAYNIMKEIMKDKLFLIQSGITIEQE